MRYDVLKDFEDKERKLTLTAGQVFIPAETHYPAFAVNALAANGTIRLIEKPQPAAENTEGI